jgi:hypothetical protein
MHNKLVNKINRDLQTPSNSVTWFHLQQIGEQKINRDLQVVNVTKIANPYISTY